MARTLGEARKKPYPAMVGALKKVQVQAIGIEHRKKTGSLLREIVGRNMAAVKSEADYAACLDYFQDIAIYLRDAQG